MGLTQQLRETLAFAETPVLAISAAGTPDIRRLALAAEATAFREKSLDRDPFLATVAHLVRITPS